MRAAGPIAFAREAADRAAQERRKNRGSPEKPRANPARMSMGEFTPTTKRAVVALRKTYHGSVSYSLGLRAGRMGGMEPLPFVCFTVSDCFKNL